MSRRKQCVRDLIIHALSLIISAHELLICALSLLSYIYFVSSPLAKGRFGAVRSVSWLVEEDDEAELL